MAGGVTRWIWVSLPYATFALASRDGRIVETAPIARWSLGKDESFVADFYRKKGAEFRPLPV